MSTSENSDDDDWSEPSIDWCRMDEVTRRIENNDSKLDKLIISQYTHLPHGSEWDRVGSVIGGNKHIKELRFEHLDDTRVSRDQFESFCSGLSSNKSIERLSVDCCELFEGETFSMLTPFFEQNHNLRCLHVDGENDICSCFLLETNVLADALSRFNTLREVSLNRWGNRDGDGDGGTLIRALAHHRNLTKIDINRSKIMGGKGTMTALAYLLANPNSSVEDLQIRRLSLGDEGAIILGTALAGNSTLRNLDLSCNLSIKTAGWTAIFAQLQSAQSLETLDLSQNSRLRDSTANVLANSLVNGTHLKVLDLSQTPKLATEGWQSIYAALQSPLCMLQRLNLRNCPFGNKEVKCLANSLSRNCALRHLDLSSNSRVTALGWGAFSAVLQSPNSALETVDLIGSKSINDYVVMCFAISLAHNSVLKELFLDRGVFSGLDIITTAGWEALSNALCNKSSINATFNSNHTLQRLVGPDYSATIDDDSIPLLPSDLQALLQLNRGNIKAEAARRKILAVHFGDFNIEPFVELKVLPHAIAWMAKDEYGMSLLYQFVRRNAHLFVDTGGATTSFRPCPGETLNNS